MRRAISIALLSVSPLLAVKFVKDVLPAAGAVTTIAVNADSLAKAIKHPKATARKVVKKVKGK